MKHRLQKDRNFRLVSISVTDSITIEQNLCMYKLYMYVYMYVYVFVYVHMYVLCQVNTLGYITVRQ